MVEHLGSRASSGHYLCYVRMGYPNPSPSPSPNPNANPNPYPNQVGPELLRVPLRSLAAAEAVTWLRGFARDFLRPGRGLTTPIEVSDVPGGVVLRFLTRR